MPSDRRQLANPTRRGWWIALAAIGVAVGVLALAFRTEQKSSPVAPAVEAKRAFARSDFKSAEKFAKAAATANDDPAMYLLAAEAATRQGHADAALGYYQQVRGKQDQSYDDLVAAGDGLIRIGHPRDAEFKFQAAAKLRPDDPTALNRLAMLYVVTGRRSEAVPYLLQSVQQGHETVHTLCLLAQAEGGNFLPQSFDIFANQARDPLPLLAVATREIQDGDWAAALKRLRRARELESPISEIEARYGQALLELDRDEEFRTWAAQLSSDAKSNHLTWYVLGLAALRNSDVKAAARAFWEALRRDPEHLPSNYQLGRALTSLGRADDAKAFLDRAAEEERLSTAAGVLFESPNDVEQMHVAATAATWLGRYWEAWGWTNAAERIAPQAAWIAQQAGQLRPLLSPDLPRTAADHRPAERLDLSDYPLPALFQAATIASNETPATAESQIRFTDDAAALQLDFQYENGSTGRGGVRMFEWTGGGVGAIDFDRDGAPDLCLTQGGRFPPGEANGPSDRLFRNLGNAFRDVTAEASVLEASSRFGQGIACGDYDGDGFGDIYVGNIGRNRLLRNNGDGTFADVTDTAGIPELPLTEAWTTSVAIADLTGDGLADLFDVNYVAGADVFERTCAGADGQPHGCAPTVFDASPDHLLVNLGDGRFEDVSAAAGITAERGNGLGVVVADFTGDGQCGIFVANDQTANHFYLPTGGQGDVPQFEEQALAAGLAFDRDGKAQACMGVAADDENNDGRLDLFVTNFFLESNTLYRGVGPGTFADASDEAGLREPSYRMLGFGTQFLDAELDGWPDLIVANGHIDDFTSIGTPYRMRPQVFRNHEGHFNEVDAASLGNFFSQERLGRGLATLDWNGDGREDIAISHLDSPFALLTNRSDAANGFGVRLVATTSARDATGATVTARKADRLRTRQLTAGNGYQASNDPCLAFGLGEDTAADVAVRWPSGKTEQFGQLHAGCDWMLIEGRGRPLKLRDYPPYRTEAVADR
jgi:tetratricopeptide (TPR) repeat protein